MLTSMECFLVGVEWTSVQRLYMEWFVRSLRYSEAAFVMITADCLSLRRVT